MCERAAAFAAGLILSAAGISFVSGLRDMFAALLVMQHALSAAGDAAAGTQMIYDAAPAQGQSVATFMAHNPVN